MIQKNQNRFQKKEELTEQHKNKILLLIQNKNPFMTSFEVLVEA